MGKWEGQEVPEAMHLKMFLHVHIMVPFMQTEEVHIEALYIPRGTFHICVSVTPEGRYGAISWAGRCACVCRRVQGNQSWTVGRGDFFYHKCYFLKVTD